MIPIVLKAKLTLVTKFARTTMWSGGPQGRDDGVGFRWAWWRIAARQAGILTSSWWHVPPRPLLARNHVRPRNPNLGVRLGRAGLEARGKFPTFTVFSALFLRALYQEPPRASPTAPTWSCGEAFF